jgi:[ribosomal protein S5]-alanine N-acetyltransferase
MINLREFKQDDASALVALANNENVSRYMTTAFPYPYTAEDAEWWIS